MKITSMHNDLVKYWVSLKTKKVRDKERKFIVEGDHLINEARKNNLIEYIISCVDENADYFVTKEIMEAYFGLNEQIEENKEVKPYINTNEQ